MVGTQRVARQFANAFNVSEDFRMRPGATDPEDKYLHIPGFTFLGEGCSRTAYLHDASRVVYKMGSGYDNGVEVENSIKFRRHKWADDLRNDARFNVYIPAARLPLPGHEYILAMEYADGYVASDCASLRDGVWNVDTMSFDYGDCSCTWGWCHRDAWEKLNDFVQTGDMHWSNALFNAATKTYFIVDLA